jgi:hypothetical protein
MKTKLKHIWMVAFIFATILRLNAQGYIVPNGVVYLGFTANGYSIEVLHDPARLYYTGFFLDPFNTTYFQYDYIVDIGVRVFFVSSNTPISLQPILSQSWTELTFPNYYAFDNGNMVVAPRDGIYTDPLFGWVELVNNNGVIQLLDSALEYRGLGIIAGTQTILQPVPEPSTLALTALGGLCFLWRRCKQ